MEKQTINLPNLGDVHYNYNSIIIFPDGLIGFEQHIKYVMFEKEEYRPFKWLVSLEQPRIIFNIIEPVHFWENYHVAIPEAALGNIDISNVATARIYTIVTIDENKKSVTANLASPIIINNKNRLGKQVILEKSAYPVRYNVLNHRMDRKQSQGRQNNVNSYTQTEPVPQYR